MKVYNKLVRDRIPEIIENSGKKANYRVLSEEEFKQALKDKLLEEVNELLAAETKEDMCEEIIDIFEVIWRIERVNNLDQNYLVYIQDKKGREKGCFYKQYFLESVEE